MAAGTSAMETLVRDACRGIYQERETEYQLSLSDNGRPLSGALSRVYPEKEGGASRMCVERPLGADGRVAGRIKYSSSFLEFLFLSGRLPSLGVFSSISYVIFRPWEDIGSLVLNLDIAPFLLTTLDSAGGSSRMSILVDKAPGWTMEGFSLSCANNPPIHVSKSQSNQIAFFESYEGGRYVITLDVLQYISSWIGFFPVPPRAGEALPFRFSMTLVPPRGTIRTVPASGSPTDADPPEHIVRRLLADDTVPDTDPYDRVVFAFTREVDLTVGMIP